MNLHPCALSFEIFSKKQVSELEAQFQKNPYPNLEVLKSLAQTLDLKEEQVKAWFQQRRNAGLYEDPEPFGRPTGFRLLLREYKAFYESIMKTEGKPFSVDIKEGFSFGELHPTADPQPGTWQGSQGLCPEPPSLPSTPGLPAAQEALQNLSSQPWPLSTKAKVTRQTTSQTPRVSESVNSRAIPISLIS